MIAQHSTRRSTHAYSDKHVTLGRLAELAVHAARAELCVVPAAATRDRRIRGLDRARPLPGVTSHVVSADRATRGWMRANLVGTERERIASVGHGDVRVIGQKA